METKTQLNWITQCSICFKTTESSLKLFSLRYLCRYLRIEFKQLFFKCAKKVEHSNDLLEVKTDLDKAEVNLCCECGKVVEKLTEQIKSLEKIQMEVDWWLDGIRKLIIESDKMPKYVDMEEMDGVDFIWAEMMKQVRKSIVNIPMKLSTLKPIIGLKRCRLKIDIEDDILNQDISVSSRKVAALIKTETDCVKEADSSWDVMPEANELPELNCDVIMQDEDTEDASYNYTPAEEVTESEEESDDSSFDLEAPSKLIDHGIRLTGSKRVKCKMCSQTFSSHSCFTRHYGAVHLKNKMHKCQECPMEFSRRDHLNNHTMVVHNSNLGPITPEARVRPNFQCNIGDCDYTTKAKYTFKKHQLICKGKPKKVKIEMQQCQFCEEEFRSKTLLKRHERLLHLEELQKSMQADNIMSNGILLDLNVERGKRKVQCKICQGIFADTSSFHRHFRAVHLKEMKQCHLCPQTFTRRDHLYTHLRNIHNVEPTFPNKEVAIQEEFKCDIGDCNYITNKKYKLNHHQLTCQGIMKAPKVVNFKCEICGSGFGTEINLKNHQRQIHSGKVFKCDECGKEFSNVKYLKTHFERIHLKIRHECDHVGCENSYSDKRLLSLHKRKCGKPRPPTPTLDVEKPLQEEIHEEPEPQYTMDQAMENCLELDKKKYQCKVCNLIVKEKFIFRGHFKLRHVREKAFECDLCPRKFILSHHLKKHKDRMHADGQLFKCDKGQCRYMTTVDFYFRKHQRHCRGLKTSQHLNIGDHICSTCGKRFVSKARLKCHQQETHSGRKFVCDQCGKVFKRRENLQVHVNSKHLGISYSCENLGCGKKYNSLKMLNVHKRGCLN